MAIKVGGAGRKYKVPYPTLYASESDNKDAKLYNCVQRGLQNSLEMMPMFFLVLGLGRLQHPTVPAALGLVFTMGWIFDFIGYSTGDPKNHMNAGGDCFTLQAGPLLLPLKRLSLFKEVEVIGKSYSMFSLSLREKKDANVIQGNKAVKYLYGEMERVFVFPNTKFV
ncbi:hypothetical protein IFM89_013705 [Coptis chinensis]|uniref:Uncharacterized protein n=1 Tax=Coptis chinensis TaxID=261450 RepID=A0A835GZ67_9MAGN|nr:hypothetical protein IFM89_013705 [Coptis chinensis]